MTFCPSVSSISRAVAFGGHYVWVRPDYDDLTELVVLVADGKLQVNLAGVHPFEQAFEASSIDVCPAT